MSYGYIVAGHTLDNGDFAARIGAAGNPHAGIGSVTVGGNWFHSNLGAGINDLGTNGLTSADTHDVGKADRVAVLGPVVIKGYALDNPNTSGFGGFVPRRRSPASRSTARRSSKAAMPRSRSTHSTSWTWLINSDPGTLTQSTNENQLP